MATQALVKELTKIVGRENVLFSARDLIAYSYDATQRQEMPEAIVFPRNTTEVSKIMKLARWEKVPVIPRGAGTGISGGTVPIKGGIVLELSNMNKILALDTANRRAIVEPGVINLDLQDALAPLKYMYPPDPASQKSCTLGGNIGENAGGPLCFRHGVTSKYVCGMEVVLPDGEVVEVGGGVEDIPGFDLRGLLIGSEGILGIATRLILQIVPLPEASKTVLAVFDTLDDTGQVVSDIISAGIVPAALELMDKKMCWAIEQSVHAGYPVDAEGVLLIEVAGLAESLDSQLRAISEICRRNKVRELRSAKTSAERDALWKGRKGAFGSVARLCPPYLVNDGTVPRNKMVEALRKVQEISEKYHVQIANVAHAGDGNLHPLILFDRNSPEETKAARKTGEEILDTCLALGGTISGEHGIGLEKLAAMTRMFTPAELAVMRRVKKVFDPENILNPDKLLPPGQNDGESNIPAESAVSSQSLQQNLIEIVGAENFLSGEPALPYHIDELVPAAVVFPTTTEQVSRIIKAANQFQKTVVPWGGGSQRESGPPLSSGDIVLCLNRIKKIVDFDRGNSTVRVEAGLTIPELQKEIEKYRLFFPPEPLFSPSQKDTIGGLLAAAESGPTRLMYGNVRDLVLGLTVVTPTGEIIRPGGKTMKNVAGLDLCKLFVGSQGVLGVITEAVLRLFPLPEVDKTLLFVLPDVENAYSMVSQILNSALEPGAIELIDQAVTRYIEPSPITPPMEGQIMVLIDVQGSRETVTRHLRDIRALAQANGFVSQLIIEGEKVSEAWRAYRHVHSSFFHQFPSGFKGKACVPISKSLEMFKAAKEVGRRYGLEIGIQAHAGNGILYFYVPADKDMAMKVVADLQQAADRLGGFFILDSAPLWLRKSPGIWPRPGTYKLMERLKTAFDPKNILNPGKVVGGQN